MVCAGPRLGIRGPAVDPPRGCRQPQVPAAVTRGNLGDSRRATHDLDKPIRPARRTPVTHFSAFRSRYAVSHRPHRQLMVRPQRFLYEQRPHRGTERAEDYRTEDNAARDQNESQTSPEPARVRLKVREPELPALLPADSRTPLGGGGAHVHGYGGVRWYSCPADGPAAGAELHRHAVVGVLGPVDHVDELESPGPHDDPAHTGACSARSYAGSGQESPCRAIASRSSTSAGSISATVRIVSRRLCGTSSGRSNSAHIGSSSP